MVYSCLPCAVSVPSSSSCWSREVLVRAQPSLRQNCIPPPFDARFPSPELEPISYAYSHNAHASDFSIKTCKSHFTSLLNTHVPPPLRTHRYYFKGLTAKDFGGIFTRKYNNIKLVETEPADACQIITNSDVVYGQVAFIARGMWRSSTRLRCGSFCVVCCVGSC